MNWEIRQRAKAVCATFRIWESSGDDWDAPEYDDFVGAVTDLEAALNEEERGETLDGE